MKRKTIQWLGCNLVGVGIAMGSLFLVSTIFLFVLALHDAFDFSNPFCLLMFVLWVGGFIVGVPTFLIGNYLTDKGNNMVLKGIN